jgi:acyl-CoA synthetase (AMP-forming)/AMP-acid ligase II
VVQTECPLNVAEQMLAGGRGDAAAIEFGSCTVSFAELDRDAGRCGAALLARGTRPGDRVGLFSQNNPFFVAAYLGTLRAGLCSVPIRPDCRAADLRRIVQSTGMQFLLCCDRLLPRLRPCAAGLDLAVLGEAEVLSAGARPPSAWPAIDPHRDLAAIMFTSGSTGEPKGVMVTHANIASNTRAILEYMALTADDRVMVVLPFHYCYGASLLHTHLMAGACLVIENRFLFPAVVLDEMTRRRCTGLAGVPSTYQILLRNAGMAGRRLPALRWLQQAGGRLPDAVIREILAAFPEVKFYVMYGQTEATARLSYLPPERLADKLGSIGRGLGTARLEVLRPDGTPVAPGSGEVGQIVAAGGGISPGYWGDPAETARYFRAGKLYTGDLATLDQEGFIFVVGRTREFIKAMGHRVSPLQIEAVLAEMPEVVEAAVVGVPDEIRGEAIKAFVVRAAGRQLSEDAVRAHCLSQLPNYLAPQYVEFLASLPKTADGKLARERLRT